MFKLTDHFLVPKHDIMPKEEVNGLLKRYGLTFEKLPRVLLEDPIVEEIGAKRGDIIKILRKSYTAGESIYFRMVV